MNSTAEEVLQIANRISASSKALVILSGGMDSVTCLYLAKLAYKNVAGISFNYGQKHSKEVKLAEQICKKNSIPWGCIDIDIARHFKTALGKDSNIDIPDQATEGVPPTYVPFRNTIMLSIACGYAESWDYDRVIYGANIIDYSGYPDCRPEYLEAFNSLVHQASPNRNILISAPIMYLPKSEVVRLGNKLGVPWELTWSCYRGGKIACGHCPSCQYRLQGFNEAGMVDPIEYERRS